MWIIPKPLLSTISPSVLDTAALTLGLAESSEACAQSLLVRSKPSPVRIWSRKWKRDCWTWHLSGRICGPSHLDVFTDSWTSSLGGSPVSPSAPQESEKATKTLATSSPTSSEASPSVNQTSSSSKTSRVSLAQSSKETAGETPQERPFCSMSLESWKGWVTGQRQEYSARLKSGRVISESGCSSSAWPTPRAEERLQHNSRDSYVSLGVAVNQPAQSLPDQTNGGGNRPESSTLAAKDLWQTPDVGSVAGGRSARGRSGMSAGSNEVDWKPGQKPMKDGKPITTSLTDQVRIADQWMTPRSCEWKGNGPNSKQQGLCNQVNWPTPMSYSHGDSNPPGINQLDADVRQLPSAKVQWGTPRQSMAQDKDKDSGKVRLGEQVHERHPNQGKLNPRWVETLMGLPIGWTMPSCQRPWTIVLTNSDSSETVLTPMLPPKHS